MGFIGDWFGKGGSSAPEPPPMPAMPDYGSQVGEMMGMMQEMMGGMMEGMASSMQSAQDQQASLMAQMDANMENALPQVYRDPVIDWTDKQSKIAAKAKADFHIDQTRRKGRTDTILTSPLLDDEDAQVTESILTGQ